MAEWGGGAGSSKRASASNESSPKRVAAIHVPARSFVRAIGGLKLMSRATRARASTFIAMLRPIIVQAQHVPIDVDVPCLPIALFHGVSWIPATINVTNAADVVHEWIVNCAIHGSSVDFDIPARNDYCSVVLTVLVVYKELVDARVINSGSWLSALFAIVQMALAMHNDAYEENYASLSEMPAMRQLAPLSAKQEEAAAMVAYRVRWMEHAVVACIAHPATRPYVSLARVIGCGLCVAPAANA